MPHAKGKTPDFCYILTFISTIPRIGFEKIRYLHCILISESGRNTGFWKEEYTEEDREHSFSTGQAPYPHKEQSNKQFDGCGSSQAASRPPANQNSVFSARDKGKSRERRRKTEL